MNNQNSDRANGERQVPLKIPLPTPPVIEVAEGEFVLEHVRIDQLEAWRRQRGLVPYRVAFLGRPGMRLTHDGKARWSGLGHVMLSVPEAWLEEERNAI